MTVLLSKIVGSSHVPGAQAIVGELREGTELQLRREPGNQYDRNAVAVYLGETRLGYVPSLSSATFAGANMVAGFLDGGQTLKCLVGNSLGRINIEVHD